YLLYRGATRLARTLDRQALLEAFQSDLHLYVAEFARRRLFVHAGAVGWGGRAILIPGRSMSGKSTLVEALVRAGASYYSDEYAMVDRDGRLDAVLRPLSQSVGPGACPMRPALQWSGLVSAEALALGLVVGAVDR